jgi:hypothetical protein
MFMVADEEELVVTLPEGVALPDEEGESNEKLVRGRQTLYRDRLQEFFSDPENFSRLKRITDCGDPALYRIMLYFVRHFYRNMVLYTTPAYERKTHPKVRRVFVPHEEYDIAMRRYSKKFYNFEEAGAARIEVGPEGAAPVEISTARGVALMWFINFGFDDPFWDSFEAISAAFHRFSADKQRQYSSNYNKNKQQLRRQAEEEVRAYRVTQKLFAVPVPEEEQQEQQGGDGEEAVAAALAPSARPRSRRRGTKRRNTSNFSRPERAYIKEATKRLRGEQRAQARREKRRRKRKPRSTDQRPLMAIVTGE